MAKNVLYVEDNDDAIVFFKRIVNKLGNFNLVTHESGDALLQTIEQEDQDLVVPEIILLDINLPGMNGFEILKHIRKMNKFKHVPVIMFTSSENEQDVKLSYESGANAYLVKPDNLKTMHSVIEDTFNFWLKHNVI